MTKSEAGILRDLLKFGFAMVHNSMSHKWSATNTLRKAGLVSVAEHDKLPGTFTIKFLASEDVPFHGL